MLEEEMSVWTQAAEVLHGTGCPGGGGCMALVDRAKGRQGQKQQQKLTQRHTKHEPESRESFRADAAQIKLSL